MTLILTLHQVLFDSWATVRQGSTSATDHGINANVGHMSTLPSHKLQLAEAKIAAYCRNKIPKRFQDKLRISYKMHGNIFSLLENRPAMLGKEGWTSIAYAQLHYSVKDGLWTLYCSDRNGRWHKYMEYYRVKYVGKLLKEIDEDPTGIFYG